MDVSSIVGPIGFGAACALAASISAIFRPGDWYERLESRPGGRRTERSRPPGQFFTR